MKVESVVVYLHMTRFVYTGFHSSFMNKRLDKEEMENRRVGKQTQ